MKSWILKAVTLRNETNCVNLATNEAVSLDSKSRYPPP